MPRLYKQTFSFYIRRTLYTKPYITGFGQELVTTSKFKARTRFIKIYEDPVLLQSVR